MSISKCFNVMSKLSIANLSVRKPVYFSYVYKHITYDQIGRMTLPLVKTDLNEAMLSLSKKSNLKFLTPECKLTVLPDSHSELLGSS